LVHLSAVFVAAAGRKKVKQSKILMWSKCTQKKGNKQMHLPILNYKITVIWKDQEQIWEYKRLH
jgi:hypothetical protein